MSTARDRPFVSRGGVKLQHAIEYFGVAVGGRTCVDLGCSTGGFADCLLQAGAARVYCVDTAYGQLAWTIRQDPRSVVFERSNALHLEPAEPVDLAVVDLGWTRQARAVPAAARWLGPEGRIISLIKPHYEAEKDEVPDRGRGGVIAEAVASSIVERVIRSMPSLGVRVDGLTRSPIDGGKGNAEWLALLARVP